MQTLAQIKAMLAERGLAPRHSLGQNFLLDHNLIAKLVAAADLAPGDTVLEIGPGTGVLTEALLERGAHVVAGELDRGLAALLRDRLASNPAFTLVEGDALASKNALNPALLDAIRGRPFQLVANLPYGIATPLIITLLVEHHACRAMHVTIQREVADRLMAAAGSDDYGPVSVLAGAIAHVRRIAILPPECFWPRPEVTSAMISITRRPDPLTDDPRALGAFCQELFSKRRKQLGSVLGRDRPFPQGIDPAARVESLGPDHIIALHRWARPPGA